MKVSNAQYPKQLWKADGLLHDFVLEDSWLLPFQLDSDQDMEDVKSVFNLVNDRIVQTGMAGLLFRLRLFLGRIFKWDDTAPAGETRPGKIKQRYLTSYPMENTRSEVWMGSFSEVYNLEQEFMGEIENYTVLAALHLGKTMAIDGKNKVYMGVYSQPKGLFGRMYMAMIKPFRVFIVYPTIMRLLKEEWVVYNKKRSGR